MKPLLFLSLFTLFLFSCKSQTYTLENLPEDVLVFGSGGGFSGEVKTYTLLENGQVFYSSSLTKEHTEMERLTKKEATSYYEKLEALKLSDVSFDHPGNIYYFIEDLKGDESHRIIWGSNDHEVSEEYKTFYKELRSAIK